MAPHSSTFAQKISWMEKPGRLQSMGSLELDTERLHFHFSLSCIGEGNGNPLQCSCLENPRDGGAWWDAVYGVAQSRTRLKDLAAAAAAVNWLHAHPQLQGRLGNNLIFFAMVTLKEPSRKNRRGVAVAKVTQRLFHAPSGRFSYLKNSTVILSTQIRNMHEPGRL